MSDKDVPSLLSNTSTHVGIQNISLKEETEKRYLTYALSVISSRALPDVRDGLKPVQRRILYGMYSHLKLLPTGKYRKSAAVVGEVMGKYHPHGDQAIYDAMVRMAQDFSLRYPLVEGYGNFGSLDGDKAAAMRYTEVRLQPLSLELLEELKQETVPLQANFDGTLMEPMVLPSRFPNLLVNGSSGIAVGMATNIPPHNIQEVMDALLFLMDHPDADMTQLMKLIKGPDFPTGGEILTPKKERQEIYESGQGSFTIRGTWKEEKNNSTKNTTVIIESIPYNVQKSSLVEKIAEIIISKKMSALLDVRDESTEEVRIVLEIKKDTNPELVMAYLYKNTPMEQKFSLNMTCLVPQKGADLPTPSRLSLKEMLQEFIQFRLEVLRKRFQFELNKLLKRIHLLQGFQVVFHDLDQVLQVVRNSDGKKDSASKLLKMYPLDEEQVEAILETKLYKLSKLEITQILEELELCEQEANQIKEILDDPQKLVAVLKKESMELREIFPKERRTKIKEKDTTPQYAVEDFIDHEDTFVVVTEAGWIKRIKSFTSEESIRIKENDTILSILPGNTSQTVGLVSNLGSIYTIRIWDLMATTGYGAPVQTLFHFKDQERLVACFCFDHRIFGDYRTPPTQDSSISFEPPSHLCVVTKKGMGMRISAESFLEPSTKNGRKIVRLDKKDEVLNVFCVSGLERLILVSDACYCLLFPMEEVKYLSNAGKGVSLMQLKEDETLFASGVSMKIKEGIELLNDKEKEILIAPDTQKVSKRNLKGSKVSGTKSWLKTIPKTLQFEALENLSEFSPLVLFEAKATTSSPKTSSKPKSQEAILIGKQIKHPTQDILPLFEKKEPKTERSLFEENIEKEQEKTEPSTISLLSFQAPQEDSYEEKKRRLMEELAQFSWNNVSSPSNSKSQGSIGQLGTKKKEEES